MRILSGFCLAGLLGLSTFFLQAEEIVKNGAFAEGEAKWKIDGKSAPTPDSQLLVTLNDRKWTLIEQELSLSRKPPSTFTLTIVLQASSDFKPEDKSKEYSEVNFPMGGSYVWSARVFPKADCLIQASNQGGWDYRPVKLSTSGSWQTLKAEFGNMRGKETLLTLAFPPATGTVRIKSISADLKDAN